MKSVMLLPVDDISFVMLVLIVIMTLSTRIPTVVQFVDRKILRLLAEGNGKNLKEVAQMSKSGDEYKELGSLDEVREFLTRR